MPSRSSARLAAAMLILASTVGGSAAEAPPREAPADEAASRGEAYSHLMRSLFAARRGEFRVAAAEVRQAVQAQPESPAVRVEGARLLQRMGRSSDAEEQVRDALAIAPDHPEALRLLADMVGARALTSARPDPRTREEALRLYERLLEVGEEDDQLLKSMAGLKLQAGDRRGALELAQRLVELRPGDRRATASLAQLLLEDGRQDEALDAVLRFIAKHPDDEGLVGLADELVRRLEAWPQVDETFSAHGDFAGRAEAAHRLWGEALLHLDQLERAARSFELAIEALPDDPALGYRLASVYRVIGRLADAAALARGMTESHPADGRAHFLLAETLESQGDHEGALNAFSSALRIFGADEEAEHGPILDMIRQRMALLYLRDDKLKAAGEALAGLTEDDQADALELMARVEIAGERWSEARQTLRRLKAAGGDGSAALLEGEILARTGRWAKAEAKFDEAVRSLGQRARDTAAQIWLDVEREEPAERLIREWVAEEPDNPDAHFSLGFLMFRLDRFVEAEPSVRRAFELDERHATALNFLGYTLAERDERLDEALDLVRRALEVEAWNGAYLDSLGWVYYRLGRFEEAREPLERAAREYPKDPTVLEHLGDLYSSLGRPEMAVAAWNRALAAGPEDRAAIEVKIAAERQRSTDPQALAGGPPADPATESPMRP